ncbi:putative bifunctional diguanylate cyclase/phosphodiesterase [Lentzea sp. NPDC102401]|uniref:putative bifunctional diguanylate cyclase/phosphodiesterase n=1 Tax=Lentzea sp. NPDC102401 TaxID=3364128 RepID=UPI00382C1422
MLTNSFAWLACAVLVIQLVVLAEVDGARLLLGCLVISVLCCWWFRPAYDGWLIAAVEGLVAVGAAIVLMTPQPVIAFLFAVTTRRALRGGSQRFPPKAFVVLFGYLAGASFALSRLAHVDVDLVVATLLPLVGLVIGSVALHETVRASQLADNAHRTVAALVHASPVGLALLDADGRPALHNERAGVMFGWNDNRKTDRTVPCAHEPDIIRCDAGCRASGPDPVEVAVSDVGVISVHSVPVTRASGPVQVVVAAVDVSRRRQLEDTLRDMAERDALTGLVSRAQFMQLLTSALENGPVGLLVIDLDQFKEINDADGHEAGDDYLRSAARCITDAIGLPVIAGRLGGDEFAVLAPGHNSLEASRLAVRLLAELASTTELIRASVGVAVSSSGTETAQLLRDADTAMYAAKREGGGRMRLFRPAMGDHLLARQRDRADLRTAVENGQLVVHYQPIVELSTSAVTGAEALVRWQRPGRGLIGPSEFIGLAEETGLIVPLGEHVLDTGCRQAVRWLAQGHALGVTVNVSTRQLSAPVFLPALNRVLDATALPPGHLTIEVTESVWADEGAMRGLAAVRDLGVRVALDDFGTGYSSLSYLRRYPFDIVKIDSSFIRDIDDRRTGSVIRCVIDLAEVLGAQTVAEGIETEEQAEWLRRAGCGFAQGYLFGKPESAGYWDEQPPVARGGRAIL